MNQFIIPILIAIIGSGLINTIITLFVNKRVADAQVANDFTASARNISESAMEQLERSESERVQLETTLSAARKQYSEALVDITRMEEEFRAAMENLERSHEVCMHQLQDIKQKYTFVLEENIELRKEIEDLRCMSNQS